MTLEETLAQIKPLDKNAMDVAAKRWDSIAKPLHSLGKMEKLVIQIAGITGNPDMKIQKRALVPMCADNGVVEEGVTQTGQEVTAIVAENFLSGDTSACVMSRQCGTKVIPVDIGMAVDTPRVEKRKIAYGTKNMTKEPAMTRAQAVAAIEAGIAKAQELKNLGYELLATGEMGIGNTTTSSAVTAALLQCEAEEVTGRGAGLTDQGLTRKQQVVRTALETYDLWHADAFTVLQTVGGLDIAGLTGMCIGGALWHIPIVLDGVISMAAALVAERLFPGVREYLLPSHLGKEPAAVKLADALRLFPVIHAEMALGEGTGAVMMFTLLDMAMSIYGQSATFSEIEVEQYRR